MWRAEIQDSGWPVAVGRGEEKEEARQVESEEAKAVIVVLGGRWMLDAGAVPVVSTVRRHRSRY